MVGFSHLDDRAIHHGHVWDVVVGRFRAPDGTEFERDIVRSPGAVGVIPLGFDPEGRPSVILVEQYRPALGRGLLEIPAGMRDVPGETAEETARRELAEEVGLAAGELVPLIAIHPSPGMTDSSTVVFLATGCSPVAHDRQGPEEEHLEIRHLPLEDALDLIDAGEITDAKTVAGLFALGRRLGRE